MPITEAHFVDEQGQPCRERLVSFGPTLQVLVGKPSEQDHTQGEAFENFHALVDTGATESCIDEELAKHLDLPLVDVRKISGASGSSEHNVYMAVVEIPDLNFRQYGQFTGVGLREGGQQHAVLLGRTFLDRIIMIYDGFRCQVTLATTS